MASPLAPMTWGLPQGPKRSKMKKRAEAQMPTTRVVPVAGFFKSFKPLGHTGGLRPAKGAQRHLETCLVVLGPAKPTSNVCAYAT